MRNENQQQNYNNSPSEDSLGDDYDYRSGFKPSQPLSSHHNGILNHGESYQSDYDNYESQYSEQNEADDKYSTRPDENLSYFPHSTLESNMDQFMGMKIVYLNMIIISFSINITILFDKKI